jgi:hypothetical protein
MNQFTRKWDQSFALFLILATLGLEAGRAGGQERLEPLINFENEPILPRRVLLLDGAGSTAGATMASGRAVRFQMFGMPAAFLRDPVGLDTDDDNPATAAAEPFPGPDGPGDFPLGVALGADNPYFEFRMPGDPGGVGYQRVYTQYQVIGDRFTCMCLGFQAFVPAGLENDGLANGPTVLSPNLSLFHEWDSGFAVQGFVGKHLPARAGWTDNFWRRSFQAGFGVQSPFPGVGGGPGQGVHWFVEALGSVKPIPHSTASPTPFLGVIPGLHWQLRDNWWMSSGVVLPVGITHAESGKVQITCSWRF